MLSVGPAAEQRASRPSFDRAPPEDPERIIAERVMENFFSILSVAMKRTTAALLF
jgi:hypothetical protein